MRKGQRVMIYLDPFIQEKPEGLADLLKLESDRGEMQYWLVRFVNKEIRYR